MAKTIGIISIKGGVGKTSTVAALGAAMANVFGKKALLVDANYSAPNLGLHLGLVRPDITLHDVLNNNANIKEAIHNTDYGFHFIPGALVYGEVNPFKLRDKLRTIKRYYDVILIDSSPTLNEEILSTMVASDELLVVATPDHVTLSTTLRAIKLAKERKTPISGIILNKVHGKNFELSLEEIEETSNCNVLAVLPYDISVLEALSKYEPLTSGNKDLALEYIRLAGALVGEEYGDKRFKTRMKKLFGKTPKQEINRLSYIGEQE